MYTDISFSKFTVFTLTIGALFLTVIGTFYMRRYIPLDKISVAEITKLVQRDAKSIQYNVMYSDKGGRFGQLASLGSFFLGRNWGIGSDSGTEAKAIDIPVLVYHGIVSKPDRFSMTAETFSDQMFALKKAGYRTITMEELNGFMHGEKIPDKSFLLTFDDGRRDSFEGADPVLKALGFKAVMFVATGDSLPRVNEPTSYYLDSTTLARMVESGRWQIGSHAIQQNTNEGQIPIDAKGREGNFLSNKMWLADKGRLETRDEYLTRITKELSDSKKDLEEKLGVKVIGFSYPFSDFGQQSTNNPDSVNVISRLVKENYSLAFQQIWPIDNSYILNFPDTDPYHMRRIESNTSWTGDYLVSFLESGRTKELPYTDTFLADKGWSGTWGLENISENKMHLSATPSTTGAFAFLDGTRNFGNYMYTITAFLDKGSHISLISRFKDVENNVACVFSPDAVRVEQRINGERVLLSSVKNTLSVPYPLVTLGASVNGRNVSCLVGSDVMAYGTIREGTGLSRGGIALQVWNPKTNNASMFVSSVKAVPYEQSEALRQSLPNYDSKTLTQK